MGGEGGGMLDLQACFSVLEGTVRVREEARLFIFGCLFNEYKTAKGSQREKGNEREGKTDTARVTDFPDEGESRM